MLSFSSSRLAKWVGAAVFVVAFAVPQADAGKRRLPAWAVSGVFSVDIPAGTSSLAGRYGYDLGEFNGNLTIAYDGRGTLSGAGTTGTFGSYIFGVVGTWDADPATGRPRMTIAMEGRDAPFEFQGVLSADGLRVDGTYTQRPGFAFQDVTFTGPLSLGRTPPTAAPSAFRLRMETTQDLKGRIKALIVDPKARKARDRFLPATIEQFGGTLLEGGTVKGKVKTAADGTTTAKLVVRGKRWNLKLTGPVDGDGFHGAGNLRSPLFNLDGVAVTLPTRPGPQEPPPPPPPAPDNQLEGAFARVENGQVEITRGGVPGKFFGKRSDLTIQFPTAAIDEGTFSADPANALGGNARRFFFTQGKKTYGTATDPADVQIVLGEVSLIADGTIRLTATGQVALASGKTKNVDVVIIATVL